MNISKVAAAVALSTGLLFGCDGGSLPPKDPTPQVPDEPTSLLEGGYWQIAQQASPTTMSAADLPNVYVFDNGTQRYYYDDKTPGVYEVKTATYEENLDAETLEFTFYGSDADGEVLTGDYSVENGAFSMPNLNVPLTGSDEAEATGVKDAVIEANKDSGVNNAAHILDTLGGDGGDTGEMRLKLPDGATVDSIASGKLTVDFIYQEDADTAQEADGTGDNAYISFYAQAEKNANLHGEVIFEHNKIKYRDSDSVMQYAKDPETGEDATFTPGEELEVEANWGPETFSFSVNGIEYAKDIPVADGTAVKTVALRLGDNGNTTNYEVVADNLKIYSHDTEADTLVFEDDFDSRAAGTVLTSSPYSSNGSQATVITVSGEAPTPDPEEPTDPETPAVTDDFESYTLDATIGSPWETPNVDGSETLAEVVSDSSISDSKILHLADLSTTTKPFATRAFKNGEAAAGSVTIDAYFPSSNAKSTYINIGSGKNNSDRYFELNQSGTSLKYEAGSDDPVITTIEQDKWYTITLAWTEAGEISVSIDGEVLTTVDQADTGLDSSNVPSQITLYSGDNSGAANHSYFDNLKSDLF